MIMSFEKWVVLKETSQEVELHHITTMPAAQLIKQQGFKPSSFKLQLEKAAEMTGADPQDQNLINAVMNTYKFGSDFFHKERNIYFFTNVWKQEFISDYTSNADWSPVSEALRSILEVIKNYYAKTQPQIAKQAENAQRSLYGHKKVLLTIRVPFGLLKGRNGPIDANSQEEVQMPADQANKFLATLTISDL